MAHLSTHFDPDVFVSYSHGDPRGDGRSPLKEWTQRLIRELENQILALDTEFDALNIWMDDQIDPTSHLTAEVRKTVSASGMLLIVMTKRYLASSWCHDELEWFRRQIHDRAGDAGRVFVIRAPKTDVNSWPEFLRDERGHPLIGFTFHDPEDGMPWGWPDLQEVHGDFRKELCRLHTALTKRLRELRERFEQRSRAQAVHPPQPLAAGPRRVALYSPPAGEAVRAD